MRDLREDVEQAELIKRHTEEISFLHKDIRNVLVSLKNRHLKLKEKLAHAVEKSESKDDRPLVDEGIVGILSTAVTGAAKKFREANSKIMSLFEQNAHIEWEELSETDNEEEIDISFSDNDDD